MTPIRRGPTTPALATVGVTAGAAVVGAATAQVPALGLAAGATLGGAVMLPAPAAWWAGCALVFALVAPAFANLGILPATAKFLDIPLAWGALASALLRTYRGKASPGVHGGAILRGLVLLTASVALSYAFHPMEAVRPIVYLLLIGQPFALLVALLTDPPSGSAARRLAYLLIGLALAQIPVAAFQAATFGWSDPVQGALYGKGAGAHLLGGLAVIVAVWMLARAPRVGVATACGAVALLALPLLADAKGVLLASLPVVVAVAWGRHRVLRTVLLVLPLLVLVVLYPPSRTAFGFLEQARFGRWGKIAAAETVVSAMRRDPSAILFGLGPASTVSRASFMTTDLLLRADSPLRVLGLSPSPLALTAEAQAVRRGAGPTSFNSAQSSALGILGDLGIAGVAAYLGLVLCVVRALLMLRTIEGRAVAGLWCMFLIVGVVFDWWEEPPFTVPLAIVSGLALTSSLRSRRGRPSRKAGGGPSMVPAA